MKPTPNDEVNQASRPGGVQAGAAGAQLAPAPVATFPKAIWDRVEALNRLGGDEELLRELCGIFWEESPKLVQKLREAIADSDPEAVMRAAHSLAGELGYLEAAGPLRTSRVLENMGSERNLSNAAEGCALLERELAALHIAMKDAAGARR